MTNQVFNIAKGVFAEKFRDGAANGIHRRRPVGDGYR